MMLRERVLDALKEAQKAQEKRRIATLRLINAAIVDRDIALRGHGKDKADDEEVLDILAKMVKQREESSKIYDDGGRPELAEQERDEIEIIKGFMPKQLTEDELAEVIDGLIIETEAQSLRDMGKIMGRIKQEYRGRVDMGKAGTLIKARLSG